MTSHDPNNPVPADDIDALQAILLAELRRRPADLRSLVREMGALTRLMVAQGRLAPARERQLERNMQLLAKHFDGMMTHGPLMVEGWEKEEGVEEPGSGSQEPEAGNEE